MRAFLLYITCCTLLFCSTHTSFASGATDLPYITSNTYTPTSPVRPRYTWLEQISSVLHLPLDLYHILRELLDMPKAIGRHL